MNDEDLSKVAVLVLSRKQRFLYKERKGWEGEGRMEKGRRRGGRKERGGRKWGEREGKGGRERERGREGEGTLMTTCTQS